MSPSHYPVLYSFRRCPYAIRARLALHVSGQICALREIILRNKPAHMLEISPKGTVPVLQLPDGSVVEESMDIMLWALKRNDPERWLIPTRGSLEDMLALIGQCEHPFKSHLDRYKYANRFETADPDHHRQQGTLFLRELDERLKDEKNLFGDRESLADNAIFPFVRQFANTDRAWFDGLPLGNLQSWLERHTTSDRFLDVFQKWPVWVAEDEITLFPTLPEAARETGRH